MPARMGVPFFCSTFPVEQFGERKQIDAISLLSSSFSSPSSRGVAMALLLEPLFYTPSFFILLVRLSFCTLIIVLDESTFCAEPCPPFASARSWVACPCAYGERGTVSSISVKRIMQMHRNPCSNPLQEVKCLMQSRRYSRPAPRLMPSRFRRTATEDERIRLLCIPLGLRNSGSCRLQTRSGPGMIRKTKSALRMSSLM